MKQLIYILTFVISTVAIAQSSSTIELEKKKINQALTYGDKAVAISSMYSIIAMEGPTSSYKDSLAYLYFNERNYIGCILVTNDILKNKPDNQTFVEMNAFSLETIGAVDKALEAYQKIFTKTNNNYHAYKIASLQVSLNKLEDAYSSIKKAGLLPDKGTAKVNFQVNKNFNQSVDLKPSIIYLQGIIEMELGKNKEAKASFERAVQLFPDFALAKSKLLTLQSAEVKN